MKQFLKHLFTLILFSFGLALPSYGQPEIRVESRGGTGQNYCDLINNGEDQFLEFCLIMDDTTYLEICDLHAGYDLINSDMVYVDASSGWEYYTVFSDYRFCFQIQYSAEEISDMCDQRIDYINIELFCLNDGEYEYVYGAPEDDPLEIRLCCDPNGPNHGYISTSNPDIEVNESNGEMNLEHAPEGILQDLYSNYYIFDIQGNKVVVLKDKSTSIPVQEHINSLSISSGIYIVRYWDGKQMTTQKVFKF